MFKMYTLMQSRAYFAASMLICIIISVMGDASLRPEAEVGIDVTFIEHYAIPSSSSTTQP